MISVARERREHNGQTEQCGEKLPECGGTQHVMLPSSDAPCVFCRNLFDVVRETLLRICRTDLDPTPRYQGGIRVTDYAGSRGSR